MTVILGIDPGASATGAVIREGSRLLAWTVVDHAQGDYRLGYVAEQVEALSNLYPVDVVAIEDTIAPNPHLRRRDGKSLTNVTPLLAAAKLVGFLSARFPGAVLIRPGGHGSQQLGTYPAHLVTDRERAYAESHRTWLKPAGQSAEIRHARSAWDVAGAASLAHRLAGAR